jgi:hypothetical protein
MVRFSRPYCRICVIGQRFGQTTLMPSFQTWEMRSPSVSKAKGSPSTTTTSAILPDSEGGPNPRSIDGPVGPSGWFAPRDPNGSIQSDLERLDQFEDGVVTYVDAGQLLELRLSEAGIDVTLDQYPAATHLSTRCPNSSAT